MRHQRAAIAALGAAALLAGCSGAGTPPDGTEATVGHLTLTVPDGWEEQPGRGAFDKRWVGDDVELQVSGTFSSDPTASAAYSKLDLPASLQLDDYEGAISGDHNVDGADTSLRADFTYSDAGDPKEGVWVVAGQHPYPSTSVVTITGEDLGGDEVTGVIESIRFTKTDGPPEESLEQPED